MTRVASGIFLLCIIRVPCAVADQPRPETRSANPATKAGFRGDGKERPDSAVRRFQAIDSGAGHALVRDLKFTHLTTSDGLSQSSVTKILQDRRGFMWFATRDGLNRYDGNAFVVYKHNPTDPRSLSANFVLDLMEDNQGYLWIATDSGGVNKLDPVTERFVRYRHDPKVPNCISGDSVETIARDSRGYLWFGTVDSGLDKFDPTTGTFTHYRNDSGGRFVGRITKAIAGRQGDIWFVGERGLFHLNPETGQITRPPGTMANDLAADYVYEDDSGNLWMLAWSPIVGLIKYDRRAERLTNYPFGGGAVGVASSNFLADGQNGFWVPSSQGLHYFDRRTERFTYRLQHDEANPNSLDDNTVIAVYQDRGGLLWAGTGSGLNLLNLRQEQFGHYRHLPNSRNTLSPGKVTAIYEDPNGILWVGFVPRALDRLDRKTGQLTHYVPGPDSKTALSKGMNVAGIYRDARGYVWLGGWGTGIDRFDERTGQFKHYRHNPDDPNSLISDAIYRIYGDRSGHIWVGQLYGLSRLDPITERFTNYLPDPKNPAWNASSVSAIHQDRFGTLWLGTTGGVLIRVDEKPETLVQYPPDSNDPHKLNGGPIMAIYEDRARALWVGAWDGLYRFNRQNETFTRYTENQGLPSSTIQGILEDKAGRLWLSTKRGISRFDPQTDTFRNYDVSDGLQGDEFTAGACAQSPDGEMFFGGSNGLNAFFPENIRDNPYVPPVVITSFKIFNKPVPIGAASALKKAIPYVDSLTLSYRENVFSFEFAALSYANSHKNRYRYKLENFEPAWNEVGSNQRLATYTNLDPGKYVFRVQGSNSDGLWNEQGVSLPVTITPPWWRTNWFRGLSVAVFLAILWAVYRFRMLQVQRQSRQLRDVIETIPASVWSAQPDGSVDFINRRWLEFSGFSLDQALGWDWAKAVHPEDRAGLVETWRAAIASGKAVEAEARMRSAGGHYRWQLIRSVPQHGPSGKIVKWYGQTTDIDDRKRAEETLHETETRFRTYIDHATDAFFVLDFEGGTILDVNRQACENLGYTRDELIGKTVFDFDAGLDPECLDQNIRPRIEARESVTFETRLRRKNGSVFPVEIRARAFRIGGRVVNLSLVQDITERKRAEDERERLRQLEADLAHINRVSMMGELAASIAHEVNQPLAGIVSNGSAGLRWLAGDAPNVEEVREALHDIVRDGKRAGEVIARIRSLTKRTAPPREKMDLNETVREVVAIVEDEAKKNSVIIRTHFADDLSSVSGDRVQLQQVLLNLVMNAMEAMTSVTERARQLVITTQNIDRDWVKVKVEDSGIGMDSDTMARIFEPFYTTKYGGMGMGLSISRSIIQNHGGRLWPTANDGPGTSFHFTLPKYQGEESNAGTAAI